MSDFVTGDRHYVCPPPAGAAARKTARQLQNGSRADQLEAAALRGQCAASGRVFAEMRAPEWQNFTSLRAGETRADCADCGAEIIQKPGAKKLRCKPCATERNRTKTRENDRARAAARRMDVSIAEFMQNKRRSAQKGENHGQG